MSNFNNFISTLAASSSSTRLAANTNVNASTTASTIPQDALPLFSTAKLDYRKLYIDLAIAALIFILFIIGVLVDVFSNPLSRSFRYRFTRTVNWIVLGWGKAVQTMSRLSFYALATTGGSSYLQLNMMEYSIINSLGLWIMPIALLINGWIVDKYRERTSFQWALAGHTLWNLGFALICYLCVSTPGSMVLKVSCFIYYPITSYFQSISEIVINKNNALWYDKNERGIIAGIFTLCLSVGYLLGFAGNSVIVQLSQSAAVLFLVNAFLLLGSDILVFLLLKEDNTADLVRENNMIEVIEKDEQIQIEMAVKEYVEIAKSHEHSKEEEEVMKQKLVQQELDHEKHREAQARHLLPSSTESSSTPDTQTAQLIVEEEVNDEKQRQEDLENGVPLSATIISNPIPIAAVTSSKMMTSHNDNVNLVHGHHHQNLQKQINEQQSSTNYQLLSTSDEEEMAKKTPAESTESYTSEPMKSWRDIVFTVDFVLISVCFCLIGFIRDSFFVFLNQFLQVRFKINVGSVLQLLAFCSLTLGTAAAAFVSATFNMVFKHNNFFNGFMCFSMAAISFVVFAYSTNISITIIVTGSATTMLVAVLGIRRVLSMTLGGYHMTGVITGILGAVTFFGGGLGSIISHIIIKQFGNIAWAYSLTIVSMIGSLLFLVGSMRANELKHLFNL